MALGGGLAQFKPDTVVVQLNSFIALHIVRMVSKHKQILEQGKALFYSQRLVEAYNIFRRYFDRLPFQPEAEHAEYIGMFARILCELGKEFDLNFYLGELERIRDKMISPAITYQLAVVYAYLANPRLEASKKMLESLLRDPNARAYHPKTKMMLADYYDRVHNDTGTCRQLIESIGEVSDPSVNILVNIWMAKILRDEKRYDEAEVHLLKILENLDAKANWYAFFSAKVILAGLYLHRDEMEKANLLIAEIRKLFEGRHFKTVTEQIFYLENLLKEKKTLENLRFCPMSSGDTTLTYNRRSICLGIKSPADRLFVLLAKKGFLGKISIVKNLYDRIYDAKRDDKLIYYHIHSIRKRLRMLGLPSSAIISECDGYRLVPVVETGEEIIVGEKNENENYQPIRKNRVCGDSST